MGRTVPSFRIAEAQESSEWKGFRKALPKRERPVFDEMLSAARLYTSASSAAVRTSRFEGMAMAIIFHHYRLLAECTGTLSDIAARLEKTNPDCRRLSNQAERHAVEHGSESPTSP